MAIKRLIRKGIRFCLVRLLGRQKIQRILSTVGSLAGVDLLELAYKSRGILNYQNLVVSGEHYFINQVLPSWVQTERPVFFDVGANVGEYSLELVTAFPGARVISFEPNKKTFGKLSASVERRVECVNAGLGAEQRSARLYTYSDDPTSGHASIYKEMFRSFHGREDVVAYEFQMTTVDRFCDLKGISQIDLLKIDAEGSEMEVLRGASRMLSEKRIRVVQFEFGEADIFSRVFLMDFYEVLPGFAFYRLNSDALIPLRDYQPLNEIFRFQNIVATCAACKCDVAVEP